MRTWCDATYPDAVAVVAWERAICCRCHLTRPCRDGFSCQPGGSETQPVTAGGPVLALSASAVATVRTRRVCRAVCTLTRNFRRCCTGVHVCYSSPRKHGEPCVAGHECGDGLSCHPGEQDSKRASEVPSPTNAAAINASCGLLGVHSHPYLLQQTEDLGRTLCGRVSLQRRADVSSRYGFQSASLGSYLCNSSGRQRYRTLAICTHPRASRGFVSLGVHKCYNNPRLYDEPCVAGYECDDAAGLSCHPGEAPAPQVTLGASTLGGASTSSRQSRVTNALLFCYLYLYRSTEVLPQSAQRWRTVRWRF